MHLFLCFYRCRQRIFFPLCNYFCCMKADIFLRLTGGLCEGVLFFPLSLFQFLIYNMFNFLFKCFDVVQFMVADRICLCYFFSYFCYFSVYFKRKKNFFSYAVCVSVFWVLRYICIRFKIYFESQ